MTDTSVSVAKIPAKAVSTPDLGQDTYVYSVMQIRECHCFQTQTVDQVREIMRERNLPYLVVLDHNWRIVGMVTMRDLDRGKKQSPFA
jgi:CBS domain-containing protein